MKKLLRHVPFTVSSAKRKLDHWQNQIAFYDGALRTAKKLMRASGRPNRFPLKEYLKLSLKSGNSSFEQGKKHAYDELLGQSALEKWRVPIELFKVIRIRLAERRGNGNYADVSDGTVRFALDSAVRRFTDDLFYSRQIAQKSGELLAKRIARNKRLKELASSLRLAAVKK